MGCWFDYPERVAEIQALFGMEWAVVITTDSIEDALEQVSELREETQASWDAADDNADEAHGKLRAAEDTKDQQKIKAAQARVKRTEKVLRWVSGKLENLDDIESWLHAIQARQERQRRTLAPA